MLGRWIKSLIHPHVLDHDDLVEEYRQAALDGQAEKEALEWIETQVDEAFD